MPKRSSHVLELAKRGAELRLRELAQEAKYLIELFPHLRDAVDKNELPLPFIIAKGSGQLKRQTKTSGTRRRRTMSLAARKRISEAQRARWVARRKAQQ